MGQCISKIMVSFLPVQTMMRGRNGSEEVQTMMMARNGSEDLIIHGRSSVQSNQEKQEIEERKQSIIISK
ncbi:hypothetical protein pb186bvf_019915 [Paramecium bursaria]